MTWHMDDMQNQDNVQDALADWRSGLFDEQDAAIQRKLDAERNSATGRRRLRNLAIGCMVSELLIIVGCLLLSGCTGITGVVEPVHRTLFQQDCTSVPGYCVPLASKRVP